MGISLRFVGFSSALSLLVALGQMVACTTDDSDPGERVTSAGGSTSNGTGGESTGDAGQGTGTATSGGTGSGTGGGDAGSSPTGTGGGSSASGTACANSIKLETTTPGIADFEGYGGLDVTGDNSWSFALGGDSATGVYAGPFVYGDHDDTVNSSGLPETYGMVEGHESEFALSISDTLAEDYGGGMGLWMSTCLDATEFTGISFWVRGNAPTGKAKISLLMEETTFDTPDTPTGKYGTCSAADETACVHPSVEFDVTDTWTEVEIPWTGFAAGRADGTDVKVDGHNIWQIQFDIGVMWVPDDAGVYQPTPAPYELVVDDMTFY